MVGEKLKKLDQKVISSLKITKLKLSRKDLRQSLSKKPQKVKNLQELLKVKENQKEDDIF